MRNYIGLIHKESDSDFGVSFPDFPGVVTAGKSLEEAHAMAEERKPRRFTSTGSSRTARPFRSPRASISGNGAAIPPPFSGGEG